MSYSFEVRGADKADAVNRVGAELDKVAQAQPIHKADREQIHAAAQSLVDMLGDAQGKDVAVTASGWIATHAPEGEGERTVTAVSLNLSAALVPKKDQSAGEPPAVAG